MTRWKRPRRRLQVTLVGPLQLRAADAVLDGACLGRRGEDALARLVTDRGLVVA